MRVPALAALCVLVSAGAAVAQTNVVTNGSFETSAVALTGWLTGPATTPGGTGTCGFNAAVAPGTETVTGTAGFAAAQGSNIALGSTATTTGANYDCVLYQDVAIPVGAVTATFSGSWGVKLINGLAPNHGGAFAGIYATTKVPNYLDPTLVGSRQTRVPAASDAAFATFADTAFNVSAVAGTTVRLALHIVTDQTEGKAVAGFDNIQLLVTTAYRVTYNGNGNTGGSVPVDAATYATGATVTVKANTGTLVKTGSVFAGWNTAANGTGTSYAATGAVTFTMGAANVTLFAQWTAATTYTVTYDGNGSSGGSVPVDAGTYATGATVTVKANTGTLVRIGYVFNGWNTAANGTGTSYAATGAATFTMGAANVTLYARWSLVSHAGSSPTGTGTITAVFTGGDTGCGFTAQQFIPLTGNPSSPPAGSAPTGVTFPHGLFNFTVSGCATPGGTLTFTVIYPQALATGTQIWKYGRTASDPTSHWYVLPATIIGTTATFSITDGGLGDDDLTANGTIVDPDGPGVPAAVPTMGEWAIMILAMLFAAAGGYSLRRRKYGEVR